MANVLVEESYLQGIADAIRIKNGTNNTYTPAQMEDAIKDINNTGIEITSGILGQYIFNGVAFNSYYAQNSYYTQDVSINQSDIDITQFQSPCYILEFVINYPYYDDSWSGIFSFGGDSTQTGVIFVNSHWFCYYKNGSRHLVKDFGNIQNLGDCHIAIVCTANKTCLYKDKVLNQSWEDGYLYGVISTETTCRIGRNKTNNSEYFKGILKKVSLTVKDISGAETLTSSDFEL